MKERIGVFVKENRGDIICVFLLSVFLFFVGLVSTLFCVFKFTNTNSISIGEQRYSLIDNLFDDDSFKAFRHDEQRLNNLGEFYNSITKMENAKLLSLYTQPVNIDDFKGERKFYYNSDAFLEEFKTATPSIKALQINNIAFEYYGLKVKKGKTFNWEEISYENQTLPVVLGSNYEGIYYIGDIIIGSYLIKDFKFEVVGILEDMSFIYYKTDPKFDISNYIIIPYPIQTWKVSQDDFRFEGMLYFNMINSDIVTESNTKDFLSEIRDIANSTGFIEFSIVGIDELLVKNLDLIYKVRENKLSIVIVIFICFVLLIAVIKRYMKAEIRCFLHAEKLYDIKAVWNYGKIYILSFLISQTLQVIFIHRIYRDVVLMNMFILFCVFIIVNFTSIKTRFVSMI